MRSEWPVGSTAILFSKQMLKGSGVNKDCHAKTSFEEYI